MKSRRPAAALAATMLASVVALAACHQEPINSPNIAEIGSPNLAIIARPIDNRDVKHQRIIVCKDGSSAVIRVTTTFPDGTGSTADISFPFDGKFDCVTIGEDLGMPLSIAIEEISAADGFALDRIMVTELVRGPDGVETITGPIATFDNPWTASPTGAEGWVVEFKNERKFEGCTPGAWKNRLLAIGAWVPTGLSPDQSVGSLFATAPASLAGATLLEALEFDGGNEFVDKVALLIHHAVAAALNAGHPDIDYPFTQAEVIAMTDAAIASGHAGTVLDLKDTFDAANNEGCFDD